MFARGTDGSTLSRKKVECVGTDASRWIGVAVAIIYSFKIVLSVQRIQYVAQYHTS